MKTNIMTIFALAGFFVIGQAQAQSPFSNERNYMGADHPYYSILADIDGDGIEDIVSSHYGDPLTTIRPTVGIKKGNGDGTFHGTDYFGVTGWALGIGAGDFNGDGWNDLAVACYGSSTMDVLLNDGTGRFLPAVSYPAGNQPYGLKLADFNQDTYLDVAMVCEYSDALYLYINNGDGTFAPGVEYAAGFRVSELAVGDLNGDTYPDVVTTNWGTDTIGVFLNNADGTLAAMVPYPSYVNTFGILLEDVDGNGTLDVIAAHENNETIGIYPGNGDGTFGEETEYLAGPTPSSLAYVDFDNDGLKDIIAGNHYNDSYTLLRGSDGFSTPETFALSGIPYVFATGDVDRDGKLDIIMPLRGTHSLQVMLQADLASPVIAGIVAIEGLVPYGSKRVTFTFRDGVSEFDLIARVDADGQFIFAGLPAGVYDVRVKGETTLANIFTVDTTAGDVTDVMVSLLSGDADGNNIVDVEDLSLFIQAFDARRGDANYNENTDFDGNWIIDISDLDIFIRNFDAVGLP